MRWPSPVRDSSDPSPWRSIAGVAAARAHDAHGAVPVVVHHTSVPSTEGSSVSIHGASSSTSSPRAQSPGAIGSARDEAVPAQGDSRAVAVSMRAVVKTYRAGIAGCSARVDALRGADLDIEAGSVLGVLGPVGSGKTTLLLCAAGLLRPDVGCIRWFGRQADGAGRPPGIAYVPERRAHYTFMTVREAVEYHAVVRDGAQRATHDAVDRALLGAGLLEIADARIADLPWSAGPQLAIAHGLVDTPRVLILDESLGALTPAVRRHISSTLRSIAAGGTAVVVATDALDLLDGLASNVALVIAGRVSAPVAAAALRRTPVLELTVASPSSARRLLDARVAEGPWEHELLRVPLDGTTPEAILARCRACGIRVDASRIVSGDSPE